MLHLVGATLFDNLDIDWLSDQLEDYPSSNDTSAGPSTNVILPATTTKPIADRLSELVLSPTTPSPMEQVWEELQHNLDMAGTIEPSPGSEATPNFIEFLQAMTIPLEEEVLSPSTTSTTGPPSGNLRDVGRSNQSGAIAGSWIVWAGVVVYYVAGGVH
ncbi:hypothetical protein FOL47_001434 [Perkinsus chesapeaki]|uniref:Uncharacterized protein n=1 Tax=Perkinsus chesapeaki TaxID=330153 RepID=A0A7J6KUE9_PERCH|nr:hypothetical protein FOL47_001434 [Perkinsus chesapeaki]